MRFTPMVVVKASLGALMMFLLFMIMAGLAFPTLLAATGFMATRVECETWLTVCLVEAPQMPWDQYQPDSAFTLHGLGIVVALALLFGAAIGAIVARSWIPGKEATVPSASAPDVISQQTQLAASLLDALQQHHPDPTTARLMQQQRQYGIATPPPSQTPYRAP